MTSGYDSLTHGYDSLAHEYDAPAHDSFYSGIAAALLRQLPDGFDPRSILDVGGGTGFSTSIIASAFPEARIVMVEPSQKMAELAARRCGPRVSIIRDLPHRTGAGNRSRRGFDLVFSSMSFHWLPTAHRTLLAKLVRKDGLLAVAAPGRLGGRRAMGNDILLEALRGIRRSNPALVLPTAAKGFAPETLAAAYSEFTAVAASANYVTDYSPPGDFARSLEVRGALRALFGDHGIVAQAFDMIDRSASSATCCDSSAVVVGPGEDARIRTHWPVSYWIGRAR